MTDDVVAVVVGGGGGGGQNTHTVEIVLLYTGMRLEQFSFSNRHTATAVIDGGPYNTPRHTYD